MPDISAIPAEALLWKVAGAWKGFPSGTNVSTGPGRIYALPETVRILCTHSLHGDKHNNASCLGYEPSTDLAVWLAATWGFEYHIDSWFSDGLLLEMDDEAVIAGRGSNKWIHGEGSAPLEQLLRALAQALVAEGLTLGEAPDA